MPTECFFNGIFQGKMVFTNTTSAMKNEQLRFLTTLLETPSPSGREIRAQQLWAGELKKYSSSVQCDSYGNTWAVFDAMEPDAPTLMIEAHADEIGFMIRYVTPEGFLRVECVGGSDTAIARGRRILFDGKKGPVMGITGNTAIHLRDADEKPPKTWELFIDVGASSDKEVEKMGLRIGDVGVYSDGPVFMNGKKIVCRALDNRINGFILSEIARSLAKRKTAPAWNIVLANTIQEEVGCIGAGMLAHRINPQAAICLDVTHATDSPGIDKARYGDVHLAKGPTLTHGTANHPLLLERLEKTAKKSKIHIQHEAAGRRTGTNTDALYTTRDGIPSALISLPLRYMHSPVETADMDDVLAVTELVIAFIDSLSPSDHFGYRL